MKPKLLALTLTTIIVVACGDNGDEGRTGDGPSPIPGDEARQPGGRLVVQGIEPVNFDPHSLSFPQDVSLGRMLWRGLYSLGRDNRPVPAMAESAPQLSEDATRVTVRLRDGLRWSDGDDLTAEDFVLGIRRSCDPVSAGEYQYLLSSIVGCDEFLHSPAGPDGEFGTGDDIDPAVADMSGFRDAVGARSIDARTIEFTLERPAPAFQTILSLWVAFPVPSHQLPESNSAWPDAADAPGSLAFNGPYVLAEYARGSTAVLRPNTAWRPEYSPVGEAPALNEIELRFMSDADALAAYQVDALSFARAEITQLAQLAAIYGSTGEYKRVIQPSTRGLEMNLARPPLDNLKVRLAIGKAIPWQAMIDQCSNGRHVLTTSWIPDGIPAGRPVDYQAVLYAADREAARQLLSEAGGVGRELSIVVREGPETECQGKFIQDHLGASLGITTLLEPLNAPARSARFREGSFDLFPGGWIQAYPDPENWVLGQFDQPGVGLNQYHCNDAEIQSLLDENEFNLDEDERTAAYERIHEIIVTQVCGVFPYYHEAAHYLKKANVAGMFENATSQDATIAGDWAAEAWGFAREPEPTPAPSSPGATATTSATP